jgi:hypothetical protein
MQPLPDEDPDWSDSTPDYADEDDIEEQTTPRSMELLADSGEASRGCTGQQPNILYECAVCTERFPASSHSLPVQSSCLTRFTFCEKDPDSCEMHEQAHTSPAPIRRRIRCHCPICPRRFMAS